jgi:hypothetical protein
LGAFYVVGFGNALWHYRQGIKEMEFIVRVLAKYNLTSVPFLQGKIVPVAAKHFKEGFIGFFLIP